MSTRYVDILGASTPTAKAVRRAGDIIAAMAPPPSGTDGSKALVKAEPKPSAGKLALEWAPGIAGAAAGAMFWPEHRLLGALAGHALVDSAVPLWRGGVGRTRALCNLAVEGAGIVAALTAPSLKPLAWAGGVAAGLVATSFVSGSWAYDARKKYLGR